MTIELVSAGISQLDICRRPSPAILFSMTPRTRPVKRSRFLRRPTFFIRTAGRLGRFVSGGGAVCARPDVETPEKRGSIHCCCDKGMLKNGLRSIAEPFRWLSFAIGAILSDLAVGGSSPSHGPGRKWLATMGLSGHKSASVGGSMRGAFRPRVRDNWTPFPGEGQCFFHHVGHRFSSGQPHQPWDLRGTHCMNSISRRRPRRG